MAAGAHETDGTRAAIPLAKTSPSIIWKSSGSTTTTQNANENKPPNGGSASLRRGEDTHEEDAVFRYNAVPSRLGTPSNGPLGFQRFWTSGFKNNAHFWQRPPPDDPSLGCVLLKVLAEPGEMVTKMTRLKVNTKPFQFPMCFTPMPISRRPTPTHREPQCSILVRARAGSVWFDRESGESAQALNRHFRRVDTGYARKPRFKRSMRHDFHQVH